MASGSHSDKPMNPLLFADWGRMNRLFTRVMWIVVVVMLCVVCVALAAPAPRHHVSPGAHPSAPTAAAAVSSGGSR
jgi:formate hydrogenlyase subunit 3/multisubunit Na+/H+ antiporter MnhD subunit